jgi:hypothetical protein
MALLLGGIVGGIRVATAKKFFKSDFESSEYLIPAEDYKTEVHVSSLKRWVIVAICGVVALVGVFLIQHDQNWNPFGN